MKSFLLTGIAIFLCFSVFAQKLNTDKVPQAVKNAFKKTHPNASASWEWEDANYEANFKEEGKTMSCVISKQGTILETETVISYDQLPAGAKKYLNEHYKAKKWKEVARVVKANGDVNYEVDIAGKDVLFNSKGIHLEKPKEKEED